MPHAALGEFHHVGAANRLSCATNLAREPHNISAALWQLQQQIEISAQLSSVGEQEQEEEVHRVESRKNAKWQQHLIALAKLRAKREFGAINWQGQAGCRLKVPSSSYCCSACSYCCSSCPCSSSWFPFQGEHSLRVSSLKLLAISCKLNYGCVAAKLFHFHFEQTFWQSPPSATSPLPRPMRVGPQYHM